MTESDENKVISEFRSSRDARLFDRLYRSHNQSLYAIAIRITGDPVMAGDAVHDTWLRCIDRIEKFEGRSSFRTWATGILINCIREIWRRERNDLYLSDIQPEFNGMPALPHGIDPLDLEVAIASLPPGFREVLILHDVEGFSHEEIGGMLGVVAGTSKSQLARARQRMRDQLTGHSRVNDER